MLRKKFQTTFPSLLCVLPLPCHWMEEPARSRQGNDNGIMGVRAQSKEGHAEGRLRVLRLFWRSSVVLQLGNCALSLSLSLPRTT